MVAVNDGDIQAWIDAGYSRPDAVAWIEAGCTLTEAGEWVAEGLSPSIAAEWAQFFDAEEARCWIRSGIDSAQIARYWAVGDINKMGGGGLFLALWHLFQKSKVCKAIVSFPARVRNSHQMRVSFPHGVGRVWAKRGFSVKETKRWMMVEMEFNRAVAWRDAGFTPKDALKWSALELNPRAAAELRNKTISAKTQEVGR
jgi:hypothetical protein